MTDYFTEQDDILENLLGITDAEQLKQLEADIVSVKLADLAKHPIQGNFDFEHLKEIHRYLFGDFYSFAGKTIPDYSRQNCPTNLRIGFQSSVCGWKQEDRCLLMLVLLYTKPSFSK